MQITHTHPAGLFVLGALFGPSSAWAAGNTPPAPAPKEPFLSAHEIAAAVSPHGPEIKQCYLDSVTNARRAGQLDLRFVLGRDGSVRSVQAEAAGLPAKTTHKIEACIREVIEEVQFPPRRNDTTAVVPYFFQRTAAPNAGPQPSCWNPKGC